MSLPVPLIKPLTFALLRVLADGEFHSGESMARQFDVARTTIHSALQSMGELGLVLHRVRGRGYQLAKPLYWLDAAEIQRLLGEAQGALHLEIVDQSMSSNAMLLQRVASGALSGSVLAVEWQSAGRGRMGRQWHSGLGDALTFSLLWRFERGLAALSGLSLAVGVAVVRALRELGVTQAGLKWPNDVLLPDGKLAGILLEAHGDMLGPSAVVIGIGMNLSQPTALRTKVDQPISDLLTQGVALKDRNQVLALLLKHLAVMLKQFSVEGFAGLRAEWESYHRLQHCDARLFMPNGQVVEGVVLGINNEGALRMRTAHGEQLFNAGDISLRSA
ncbi:MAG: biotin--[acetyl-CoA-carboxylase] ligase [Sideroxydans sp.]|nr:biotin--[acetyl-CoA-carboxylase] ligase [Sideroxydans sp.]